MSQDSHVHSLAAVETNGQAAWRLHWQTMGQPWRWEPEVSAERQAFLALRRAVEPDVSKGVYPFGDIRLTRADVEWLLATHDDGQWLKEGITARNLGTKLKIRGGLDLRGADLRSVDLRRLPLTQLRGGLSSEDWRSSAEEQREAATIHLERANLSRADLVEAELRSAHLEGANLSHARLDGASLRGAHLGQLDPAQPSTDLRYAYFDRASTLDNVVEEGREPGFFSVADARWGEVNVSVIAWDLVTMLGDEHEARMPKDFAGKRKTRLQRLIQLQTAVRANRQLSALLRSQGLTEAGDKFAYRAQALQRQVLRRQRQWLRWLGSLFLDMIAGYGYRPVRSLFSYVLVVICFAFTYFALGGAGGHALTWNEALVVSLTAFHGRGFFATAFQPGDPQAAIAAGEAVIGLLIEITFIATFTQRFFSR